MLPSLPDEIIVQILSSLSPSDRISIPTLVATRLVSRRFARLALDNSIWRQHLSSHYLRSSKSYAEIKDAVADEYRRRYVFDGVVEDAVAEIVRAPYGRAEIVDRVCRMGVDALDMVEYVMEIEKEEREDEWIGLRWAAGVCWNAFGREQAIKRWLEGRAEVGSEVGIDMVLGFTEYIAFGEEEAIKKSLNELDPVELCDGAIDDGMKPEAVVLKLWTVMNDAGLVPDTVMDPPSAHTLHGLRYFSPDLPSIHPNPPPPSTPCPTHATAILFSFLISKLPASYNLHSAVLDYSVPIVYFTSPSTCDSGPNPNTDTAKEEKVEFYFSLADGTILFPREIAAVHGLERLPSGAFPATGARLCLWIGTGLMIASLTPAQDDLPSEELAASLAAAQAAMTVAQSTPPSSFPSQQPPLIGNNTRLLSNDPDIRLLIPLDHVMLTRVLGGVWNGEGKTLNEGARMAVRFSDGKWVEEGEEGEGKGEDEEEEMKVRTVGAMYGLGQIRGFQDDDELLIVVGYEWRKENCEDGHRLLYRCVCDRDESIGTFTQMQLGRRGPSTRQFASTRALGPYFVRFDEDEGIYVPNERVWSKYRYDDTLREEVV